MIISAAELNKYFGKDTTPREMKEDVYKRQVWRRGCPIHFVCCKMPADLSVRGILRRFSNHIHQLLPGDQPASQSICALHAATASAADSPAVNSSSFLWPGWNLICRACCRYWLCAHCARFCPAGNEKTEPSDPGRSKKQRACIQFSCTAARPGDTDVEL